MLKRCPEIGDEKQYNWSTYNTINMNTQYDWKEQKKPYTIESKNFTIDDRSRRMMREINS